MCRKRLSCISFGFLTLTGDLDSNFGRLRQLVMESHHPNHPQSDLSSQALRVQRSRLRLKASARMWSPGMSWTWMPPVQRVKQMCTNQMCQRRKEIRRRSPVWTTLQRHARKWVKSILASQPFVAGWGGWWPQTFMGSTRCVMPS